MKVVNETCYFKKNPLKNIFIVHDQTAVSRKTEEIIRRVDISSGLFFHSREKKTY